jgi:pyrroloquinoline-quinone synthase
MPMSATLESRLRETLAAKSLLDHPFYKAWTAGTLPAGQLQEYARQYYHFEAAFPRLLSAIHSRTETPATRQLILENLWDEEHGPRNHVALWLEFAQAVGVPADEVRSALPNEQTTALTAHLETVCREAPVAEALASLFAYEGQVPAVANQKIAGLRDLYGFRPEQYEFFTVHETADIAHSGAELAAIVWESRATTDDAIVAAANAACDKLLGFLDGCYEMAMAG